METTTVEAVVIEVESMAAEEEEPTKEAEEVETEAVLATIMLVEDNEMTETKFVINSKTQVVASSEIDADLNTSEEEKEEVILATEVEEMEAVEEVVVEVEALVASPLVLK